MLLKPSVIYGLCIWALKLHYVLFLCLTSLSFLLLFRSGAAQNQWVNLWAFCCCFSVFSFGMFDFIAERFPALFLLLLRTQRGGLSSGDSQRGGCHRSLRCDLVSAPEAKFRLHHGHGVRVPPSVPSPGLGPVLPGGGWGNRQRALRECSAFYPE